MRAELLSMRDMLAYTRAMLIEENEVLQQLTLHIDQSCDLRQRLQISEAHVRELETEVVIGLLIFNISNLWGSVLAVVFHFARRLMPFETSFGNIKAGQHGLFPAGLAAGHERLCFFMPFPQSLLVFPFQSILDYLLYIYSMNILV